MEELLWSLGGILHAVLHPDSSFVCFWQAGFAGWQIAVLAIFASSAGAVALYFFNRQGIKFISKKFDPGRHLKKSASGTIRKFGYVGMILVLFIPYIPGLKEISLLTGQVIGLRYTLPVVLVCNALRMSALFALSVKVLS